MDFTLQIIFEIAVIGFIIILQSKTAFILNRNISSFSNFIPKSDYYTIDEIFVDKELLKDGDLEAIGNYLNNKDDEVKHIKGRNEFSISLINFYTKSGTYFDNIIESLNIYLVKNNGGIADFNIVKDLVERNVTVEEEDIREEINSPLYMGLMATLVGIIIGLFSLFLQMKNSEEGAPLVLGDFLVAVCIAMVSSCLGLFITTFVGLSFFKKAKRKVEHGKNEFYNFVQTELLPVVSNDFGSSISKLNQSMQVFNIDFTSNINSLSGLFQKNYDTLKVQDAVLGRLENLNANDFLKMNATVLDRLESATSKFDRFNLFIDTLNNRLVETTDLSLSLKSLLNRVNNFENIASKLDERVEQSNRIIDSVNQHFNTLDKFERQNSQMFNVLSDNMEDALKLLLDNIKSKYARAMQQMDEENSLLLNAYREKKTKFDKLDLLDNLEKLDLLNKLSKLDVLFEMKEYINVHNKKEQEGLNKIKSLENLILNLQSYVEQKKKSTNDEENSIKNNELMFAINNVHKSIEDFNKKSVFKKIFGGV